MYTKHCDETLCFHSEITHEIGFVNSKNFIIPFLSGFCRMGYEARCQQMILIHMWCVIHWPYQWSYYQFYVVRANVMISFFILGNDWLDWHNVRHDKRCNIMITQVTLVMLYNMSEWLF